MTDLKRKRILAVDDDPAILDLITLQLELAGYETYQACNGYAALDVLMQSHPDAMILDVNMPLLDGFGVLEQMKLLEILPFTPTIVLTARYSNNDVHKAIAMGAADFLAKPFRGSQLIARIGRLFSVANYPIDLSAELTA